jgi:hypothetical protein
VSILAEEQGRTPRGHADARLVLLHGLAAQPTTAFVLPGPNEGRWRTAIAGDVTVIDGVVLATVTSDPDGAIVALSPG